MCYKKDGNRLINRGMASIWSVTYLGILSCFFLLPTGKAGLSSGIVGCLNYQYMHNGTCFPCPDNCRICVSDTNCTQCQKGFYGPLCKKTCQNNCTGTCHKVYGHCTYGCQDGYYPAEDNSCQQCQAHCSLCESQSRCVLCDDGYFGETCQETCLGHCIRCEKSLGMCSQCQDSYFLHDGQCSSCSYGCRLCNTTKNCQSCGHSFHGPVDGSCLFKCPAYDEYTYNVPDENGRCGFWQDSDTNCQFQSERQICRVTGNCLHHMDNNSSCSTVMHYNCEHKCQTNKLYLNCTAICRMRSMEKGNTSQLCLTEDGLSLFAPTFKNLEDIQCNQKTGVSTGTLSTKVIIIIAVVPIVVIVVVIATSRWCLKKKKKKNNASKETSNEIDLSESVRMTHENSTHSINANKTDSSHKGYMRSNSSEADNPNQTTHLLDREVRLLLFPSTERIHSRQRLNYPDIEKFPPSVSLTKAETPLVHTSFPENNQCVTNSAFGRGTSQTKFDTMPPRNYTSQMRYENKYQVKMSPENERSGQGYASLSTATQTAPRQSNIPASRVINSATFVKSYADQVERFMNHY